MNQDDLICHCYHVPLRKLENFTRRRRPSRPSQLSECLGAGTGCGWCIPILEKIHASCAQGDCESGLQLEMTPEEYARARQTYRQSGGAKNTF